MKQAGIRSGLRIVTRVVDLNLFYTIPTFNDPKIEAVCKHCGKRRKCGKPAFSAFPTMFSTLPKTNFNFLDKSDLSSANTV